MIRDLGDGLILRHATRTDTEALVAFNAEVHRDQGATAPDAGIGAWTRDLMERPHPTFSVEDFTVVEDRRSGAIVSSLNLISQTWSYGGVPFGVGRIEMVGTHPNYRRRGLVRVQFEEVHRWSAARGELAQAITGIPWYYRQFGYEYALDLNGGRVAPRAQLPEPAEDGKEPFRVRPATPADLPFIARVDEAARRRYLVSCVRDAAQWRYELDGRSTEHVECFAVRVVETAAGEPVGFVVHDQVLRGPSLPVRAYELRASESWTGPTMAVLRYLRATGGEYDRRAGTTKFDGAPFLLESEHPVYRAVPGRLARTIPPYAWYIRVPDLPAFVRRVAPVLEVRLAASEAAGYSGELPLNFYRDGLRLVFEAGRLKQAERWPTPERWQAGASFPELTFLQLLFGYRSLDELRHAFPDCFTRTDEAGLLLAALFPKQPSFVWAIL